MSETCGFFQVNGKHCVIQSKCIVCHQEQMPQFKKGETIILKDFGPADGTYKIADFRNGTLKLEFVK